MLLTFGVECGASIQHHLWGNWPLFGYFLTFSVHRLGHTRRGGGCFKQTWYVSRMVPRAPAGVADLGMLV